MNSKISVVIPCYKVKKHIIKLLNSIDNTVDRIYVIDDCCPENSGKYVEENIKDTRVTVLKHDTNKGVGGAVITGYKEAIKDGMDIVVKLDGDGQMDPSLIGKFIKPILDKNADYTKGNRFYNIEYILKMPKIRIFGNAVLSFLNKISSGYWNIFDPTNGYTAISTTTLKILNLDKISNRYFFESDILFRLNTIKAVVLDIPMKPIYGDENSGLKIIKIIPEFLLKHSINTIKRIFYNYYLRDFSIASIELPFGLISLFFGIIFGLQKWGLSTYQNIIATSGTVMLSALPIFIGIQLLLSFMQYDIQSVPKYPLSKYLD